MGALGCNLLGVFRPALWLASHEAAETMTPRISPSRGVALSAGGGGAQFRPEPEGGEIPSENDYRENHFPKVFLFVCFSRKRNKLDDLIIISNYTEHMFLVPKRINGLDL